MSDTFGGPVSAPGDVALPRLNLADLDLVRDKIKQGIKTHLESIIDPKAPAAQRFDLLRIGIPPYVNYDFVSSYLFTHDGAREVLKISLKKAGKTDAEAAEYIGNLRLAVALDLARRVALGDEERFLNDTKPPVVDDQPVSV